MRPPPSPRVFERLAEAYRDRPGYPDELSARLLALVRERPRVVDLGAGTGHLAVPLARGGARVVAVEPAQAMLDVCAERARGLEVTLVRAQAEATGLPAESADLVVLADAAHWVDPDAAGREAHRLLGEGGVAAAVEARSAATPFMLGLDALLREANPRRRPGRPGRARQWLGLASGGAPVEGSELLHSVQLSRRELEAVLRSLSFLGPALGPRRMGSLVGRALELAASHGGARWERVLMFSWARKRALRPARR